MIATLHLRDGRTMKFVRHQACKTRFLHTASDGTTYDLLFSASPPVVAVYREPRKRLPFFEWSRAEADLDPDYLEFADGSRYVWPPRKDDA